ncbi:MAG: energy transducer TonB [Candidatus Zixiibacteriota bacterium]
MSAEHSHSHTAPTLYRPSSAHHLKAAYQRNMLVGLLGAVLLVSVPCLVPAWWPKDVIEDPPGPEELPQDTFDLPIGEEIIIIRDQPAGPKRSGGTPKAPDAAGLFVDSVAVVPDSVECDDSEPGFGNRRWGDPLLGEGDPFGVDGFGEDGVVFIPDTNVYDAGKGLDRLPELIDMNEPEYPQAAKRLSAEGTVVLEVQVDRTGSVERVTVLSDSNPGFGFSQAAVAAARTAVFSPALRNGQPVRCRVMFPVEFVIRK